MVPCLKENTDVSVEEVCGMSKAETLFIVLV